MAEVRTTVSFREEVYRGITGHYKELGFSRMGDLVNEAVREYLHRRKLEEKHLAMQRAAADPSYRSLLKEVSDELRYVDAEGPEY